MAIIFLVAVIALLITINGFYVLSEFSTVSARRPRLAQMAEEGNTGAAQMLDIVEDPFKLDRYVAACQLGITVSSLVVGFYGQSQIIRMIEPWLDLLDPATRLAIQSVLALIVLGVLTVFQVVLGELVPKNIGVQYPEKMAILTAPLMRWSIFLFRPLIFIFNGSGQIILRLIGSSASGEHAHVHSPEEILMLVEESSAGGLLDAEERRLLVNTLQLRDLTTGQVMLPRSRMMAASADLSCQELFQLLARSPYSRLPVYEERIDNIIGAVHMKDLLSEVIAAERNCSRTDETDAPLWDVRQILRPVAMLPDSMPVDEALVTMQQARRNMAIVLDEYGGTAGLLTFEDLIEEIIGEFQDEFDPENPPVALRSKGRLVVRGDVHVSDLNEALDLLLPSESANTVGGLVLRELGRPPKPGDVVSIGDVLIRVDGVQDNGVSLVSFRITPDQAARLKARGEEL
jgi:putative hemolysin